MNEDSIKVFVMKTRSLETEQFVISTFSSCIKQGENLVQSYNGHFSTPQGNTSPRNVYSNGRFDDGEVSTSNLHLELSKELNYSIAADQVRTRVI